MTFGRSQGVSLQHNINQKVCDIGIQLDKGSFNINPTCRYSLGTLVIKYRKIDKVRLFTWIAVADPPGFPRQEGALTSGRGVGLGGGMKAQIYYLVNFSRKLHTNDGNWAEGNGYYLICFFRAFLSTLGNP